MNRRIFIQLMAATAVVLMSGVNKIRGRVYLVEQDRWYDTISAALRDVEPGETIEMQVIDNE